MQALPLLIRGDMRRDYPFTPEGPFRFFVAKRRWLIRALV